MHPCPPPHTSLPPDYPSTVPSPRTLWAMDSNCTLYSPLAKDSVISVTSIRSPSSSPARDQRRCSAGNTKAP